MPLMIIMLIFSRVIFHVQKNSVMLVWFTFPNDLEWRAPFASTGGKKNDSKSLGRKGEKLAVILFAPAV